MSFNPVKKVLNAQVLDIFRHARSEKMDSNTVVLKLSDVTGIPVEEINKNALMTKLNRILKTDSNKRGEYREKFRSECFHIPTCTVNIGSGDSITGKFVKDISSDVIDDLANELNTSKQSLQITENKLKERQGVVKSLQGEKKHLKRKLERRSDYEEMKKKGRRLEAQLKSTEKINCNNRNRVELFRKKASDFQHSYLKARKEINEITKKQNGEADETNMLKEVIKKHEEQESCLQKQLEELTQSNDYLHTLINNECDDLIVYDEDKNIFTPDLVECVMNLTSFNVATRQVSPVIEEVAKLCGKHPNRLPSRSCIDNMVDRKMAVCHKQIGEVVSQKESTTLYTDETRKYGRTVEVFAISDDEHNTYVLGLREMFSKSASSTLDTFKDILRDVDIHCNASNDSSIGYQLLSNIRNTMSDRASTEKSFNALLKQYRSGILPQVINAWEDLSTEERDICSSMNNFYCGLHLLVAIADVTESALKKFEDNFLDGKDIGSATKPELKRYHRHESGTLRLIRTTSKALAMGGDEKSGAFSAWNTYLKSKGIKNTIVRYKHNRFNLIFVLGQSVFFHHEDIDAFFSVVHGTPNTLLRAVLLDIKEPLLLAGVRCLGLISKYISSPLWRIIESPGHILEMNNHFQCLLDFFDDCSKDASVFLNRTKLPFETPVVEDSVLEKLIAQSNDDAICIPLLQNIFLALYELIKRMVKEHLPEGEYWLPSATVLRQTRSVKKHNKLPEFLFGQLDHLMSFRPNATSLVNECFIMYNHNKSREWLQGLSEEKRHSIIEESRKEGKVFRENFKKRLSEIEKKRLQLQKEKQLEKQRLEEGRIKKAEEFTNEVCFYGLWQSQEEIDEGLGRLPSEAEKRKALEIQLKFRKNVLHQTCDDKKVFNLSFKQPNGKYAKHPIDALKCNVLKLVQKAKHGPSTEQKQQGIPTFVGKTIEHKFSDGTMYKGRVLCVVTGFPLWYNIKYENDEAIYVYNILEDFKKGDVKIINSD